MSFFFFFTLPLYITDHSEMFRKYAIGDVIYFYLISLLFTRSEKYLKNKTCTTAHAQSRNRTATIPGNIVATPRLS